MHGFPSGLLFVSRSCHVVIQHLYDRFFVLFTEFSISSYEEGRLIRILRRSMTLDKHYVDSGRICQSETLTVLFIMRVSYP
jgi:hypothetical protein